MVCLHLTRTAWTVVVSSSVSLVVGGKIIQPGKSRCWSVVDNVVEEFYFGVLR